MKKNRIPEENYFINMTAKLMECMIRKVFVVSIFRHMNVMYICLGTYTAQSSYSKTTKMDLMS